MNLDIPTIKLQNIEIKYKQRRFTKLVKSIILKHFKAFIEKFTAGAMF